jgi:hypothetical protein
MKLLNLTIEQQKCSEWCWASVASAVCFAYGDADAPTQAGVVDLVLGVPSGSQCDCVADPSVPCNTPRPLPLVLDKVQHAGDEESSMSIDDVKGQIDQGCPIVVQVQLPDSAAAQHAIAIYGYGDGDIVAIADPMHAGDTITVSLAELVSGTASAFHGVWQTAFTTVPK